MKDDEKRFFLCCYKFCRRSPAFDIYKPTPRDVIHILEEAGYIHHKRAWYLLSKWTRLGFYEYGVNLELGWFEPDKLPERYKVLLEKEKKDDQN